MTVKAMQWAGKQSGLTMPAKLTLIGLAAHADSNDETVVSRRKLAQWVGCSVAGLSESLVKLEDANLIARFKRAAQDGGALPSRTVLNIPSTEIPGRTGATGRTVVDYDGDHVRYWHQEM